MAPVEPGAQTSNAVPLAIYGVQLLTLAGLASAVLTTVQRAARTLPPSSDTRTASPRRRRHAALLGGLALASAAVTGYFGVAARLLSYEAWARKKEQDVPGGLWTGWYGTGDGGVRWDLGGWYQDADLVREGWEATVRRSRGFWWTGQLFVGIMGWAIFVGIEARRRNVPRKAVFALVCLAELVGLSFAQNLFYIVMLYTPVPMGGAFDTGRNPLWTPHAANYLVPLVLSFLNLDFAPYLLDSNFGMSILKTGYIAVPMLLAFIPTFAPIKWGKAAHSAVAAHRSYTSVFYWLALMSVVLYWKQGVTALRDNTPEALAQQSDSLWTRYFHSQQHTALERSRTALTRLLNAISSHPAAAAVGWDVLLSAASLCAWAFVRNLDAADMLKCSAVPWLNLPEDRDGDESERSGRHVAFTDDEDDDAASHALTNNVSPPTTPTRSRRGRPKRAAAPKSEDPPASPTKATRQSTRRRKPAAPEASAAADDSDGPFVPSGESSKAIALSGSTTERGEAGDEELVEEAESCALAWGLFVLGGLGAAGASVNGAEVRGR